MSGLRLAGEVRAVKATVSAFSAMTLLTLLTMLAGAVANTTEAWSKDT